MLILSATSILQVVQRQADADKRASQSTNLLVTLSNEFVVKRKEALSSLCQLEDYVTERSVYGCFGSQTVILAMNLCLRVLRLARNLSMDHDMDAIIKFLVKAKMVCLFSGSDMFASQFCF